MNMDRNERTLHSERPFRLKPQNPIGLSNDNFYEVMIRTCRKELWDFCRRPHTCIITILIVRPTLLYCSSQVARLAANRGERVHRPGCPVQDPGGKVRCNRVRWTTSFVVRTLTVLAQKASGWADHWSALKGHSWRPRTRATCEL